ncbi:translation elongation factor-like protein [Candidatus Bathyarchaeota archaeon]|nr:MAG: translation elongation factor-like protein [Candidatus Bathyarchaeota archaeon]
MGGRDMKKIGEITHYFSKIGVAIIQLRGALSIGEKIIIKGTTTHIEQDVTSMQIEQKDIIKAKRGQNIGLKVDGKVRKKDNVYRIS